MSGKGKAPKEAKKTAVSTEPKALTPKQQKSKAFLEKRAALIKAKQAQKTAKEGHFSTKTTRRFINTTQFKRPRTLAVARKPAYPRTSIPSRPRLDQYSILRYPLTTESAMHKIESNNTLVFIVDLHANKHQIKEAVKKLYDVKAIKVNTLIRPDGLKKAYVRLSPDTEAVDVANKIGII